MVGGEGGGGGDLVVMETNSATPKRKRSDAERDDERLEEVPSPAKKARLDDVNNEKHSNGHNRNVNSEEPIICIDTTADLERKIEKNKQERRHLRAVRKMTTTAQKHDLHEKNAILQKIDDITAQEASLGRPPLVQPGNAASKVAYGRKVTHTREQSDAEARHAEIERVLYADDLDESEAVHFGDIYRASLGLKNIGEHFMSAEQFVEHRPQKTIKVSMKSGRNARNKVSSDIVIQGDTARPAQSKSEIEQEMAFHGWSPDLSERLRNTVKAKPTDVANDGETEQSAPRSTLASTEDPIQHIEVNAATPSPTTTKKSKKSKEETAEQLPSSTIKDDLKLSRAQIAITEHRGQRALTKEAVAFLSDACEVKAIKAKPLRYQYLAQTEAPPSGNTNVRIARSEFMTSTLFNEEAKSSLTQPAASQPSRAHDVLVERYKDVEPAHTLISAGLETRHVAVVEDGFFAPDEAQRTLLRKGDRLALDMAEQQRRPSRLPHLAIDDFELREREQGRDPESVVMANARIASMAKSGSLPTVTVTSDSAHQPIYKFLELVPKARRLATPDMTEELVLDRRRILTTMGTKELVYALANRTRTAQSAPGATVVDAMDVDEEPALVDTSTGMKVLHKQMAQRARNIKRQRDVSGRQSEAEPARLRSHIADARVAFFLERWNRRDRMFAKDYPVLYQLFQTIGGNESGATSPESATSSANVYEKAIEEANFGPLGQLLKRHLSEIKDRGNKTGANFFVSSEELGSDRLHPSSNPSMERVSRSYIVSQMEQARQGEEPCANGRECVCYRGNMSRIDNATYFHPTNTIGFICKRWMTPRERAAFEASGQKPKRRGLCIVCILDETTRLVYDLNRSGIQPTRPIHDFCVFTNVEGEYSLEHQCLPPAWRMNATRQILTGIVDAFPAFNEADYVHDVREESTGVIVRFLRYRPARSGF